jgi:F-type H+-transporting ATPase subunit epsilon
MASFHFEIVSPERLFFSGSVRSVQIPATDGDMTVLAGHAPTMSSLKSGMVIVVEETGTVQNLFVRGGFADISTKGLTLLAEQVSPLEKLKELPIDAEIKAAQEDLADAKSDEERAAAQSNLDDLMQVKALMH